MGRPANTLCYAAAILLLLTGTFMFTTDGFAIAIWAGCLALSYHEVRTVTRRFVAWRYRQRVKIHNRTQPVLSILAAFLLGVSGVTFWVTFQMQRPWLGQFAHQKYAETPLRDARRGPQRVGMFFFVDVHVQPSGVTFWMQKYDTNIVYRDPDAVAVAHGGPWLGGSWYIDCGYNWWPLLFSRVFAHD